VSFSLAPDSGLVVFTGNGCQKCDTLKTQFKTKQVPFTEYNVHDNADAAEFLKSRGYRGIPVIFLNGQPAKLNG